MSVRPVIEQIEPPGWARSRPPIPLDGTNGCTATVVSERCFYAARAARRTGLVLGTFGFAGAAVLLDGGAERAAGVAAALGSGLGLWLYLASDAVRRRRPAAVIGVAVCGLVVAAAAAVAAGLVSLLVAASFIVPFARSDRQAALVAIATVVALLAGAAVPGAWVARRGLAALLAIRSHARARGPRGSGFPVILTRTPGAAGRAGDHDGGSGRGPR